MEGILIAAGPVFLPGSSPRNADLLDIAPTVLHLLGVPVPADMDGHVLTELLVPAAVPAASTIPSSAPGLVYQSALENMGGSEDGDPSDLAGLSGVPVASAYSDGEDTAIQQRLSDLGYL